MRHVDLVWYIPTPLLLLMAIILARRQAHRTFPWFFAYCVFGVAADSIRFVTRGHPFLYSWTYWLTEGGYDVLGLHEALHGSTSLVSRSLSFGWGRSQHAAVAPGNGSRPVAPASSDTARRAVVVTAP